ncbi:MAG: hypothetical protein KAV87_58690, partial [Desulfobacteraceae bacterium]|nr:hypothetical protein [Desulfobacteraceae bacterium]
VYKLRNNNQFALLKFVNENGLIAYRDVLPRIQGSFKRLVVPQIFETGRCGYFGNWVIIDWHDGYEFSQLWDTMNPELAGGRSITNDTIPSVLDMVSDLKSICADAFIETGIERRSRSWLENRLFSQLAIATKLNFVTSRQQTRLWDLLNPLIEEIDKGSLQVSNNDFQFRNFVRLDNGRIKLIDWDATRISTYEIEHCIAYQWMHMWNRPSWQHDFIVSATERLSLDKNRLRAALLICTLNHAVYWRRIVNLGAKLFDIFLNLLDDEYCDYIFSGNAFRITKE